MCLKRFTRVHKKRRNKQMICNSCQQETESGKFCTKCGAPLQVENEQEPAAAEEPIVQQDEQQSAPTQPVPPAQPAQQQVQQTNDFAEKTKEIGSNFGTFFMNGLKKPSSAKDVNAPQFISGIIMVAIFSLVISLEGFISTKKYRDDIGASTDISFADYLAVPFLKYVVLFAIIIALTYVATLTAQQNLNIQGVVAKYGAYLVPFLLLYVVSIVLDLIDMTGLPFSAVHSIAMLGPVLILPVLVLSEKAVKGFDYIYTAIVLVLLTYIAYSYIDNSIVEANLDIPDSPGDFDLEDFFDW